MEDELIYRSLKKLEGKEDRAVFREISRVFCEVAEYNRRSLQELSERLDREVKDMAEKLYVYGTVASREDMSLADHVYHPIAVMTEPPPGYLSTLAFRLTEQGMRELFSRPQRALIRTREGGVERRTVRAVPAARYAEAVREFERECFENHVFLSGLNLPYIHKFADILLTEGGEAPELLPEEIERVELEGWEEAGIEGLEPLWNVNKRKLPCAMFPEPAVDQIYYEHVITKPAAEDGYIVASDPEIARVFERENSLVIWTEREVSKEWLVYQVTPAEDKKIPIRHWESTTNRRKMTHTDRQAEQAIRLPRTRRELIRILNSYDLTEKLHFCEEIEPVGDAVNREGRVTTEEDSWKGFSDLPKSPARPAFLIRFSAENPDFVTREQVRFLLRELEHFFPEYRFEGELK